MGILKSDHLLFNYGKAALLGGFIGWMSSSSSRNDFSNHPKSIRRRSFSLVWGVASLPKTSNLADLKAKTALIGIDDCGEDSYCALQTRNQSVIAVADGVGGWRKRGVDPSAFSRGLMQVMQRVLVEETEVDNDSRIGAKALLSKSFWRLVQDCMAGKSKPFGSSTACLISLDRHCGRVEAENLGDSGFLVVEVTSTDNIKVDVQVLQKSLPQQSRFNAPFKISIHPNGNVSDQTGLSQTYHLPSGSWFHNHLSHRKNDGPAMALTKSDQRAVPYDGDGGEALSFKLAVLASDGLWDNLFEADIVQSIRQTVLGQYLRQRSFQTLSTNEEASREQSYCTAENLGEIAWDLVRLARIQAERSNYTSPFSVEASRHGMTHVGGKLDDITVIVASVIEEP